MAVAQSARKEEFEKACSSATRLIAFLRKKAENHNNYKIYTNEGRLMVTVDKQRIENSQIDTVQISAGDMLEKLEKVKRIYRAPNSMSTRHQVSCLSTQIDWDLCKSGCLLNTQPPKE